jgi:myo-inositol-1(or 4)-monophosphatase
MVPKATHGKPRVSREVSPEEVRDFLVGVLRDAVFLYRSLKAQDFRVWEKQANDPVTEIDLWLDRYLKNRLLEQYPSYGWLSEESADNRSRLGKRRTWIVDPLDGTHQLLQGVPELAISVALEEGGRPLVAMVANPETGETYSAVRGQGAWKDGRRVRVPTDEELGDARVLVSRREEALGRFEAVRDRANLRAMGSLAYKLARVAEGYAVGTFTCENRNEWDAAAGVLLVEEAGGRVTDALGKPLLFNSPRPHVRGLVASNSRLHGALLELCAATRVNP